MHSAETRPAGNLWVTAAKPFSKASNLNTETPKVPCEQSPYWKSRYSLSRRSLFGREQQSESVQRESRYNKQRSGCTLRNSIPPFCGVSFYSDALNKDIWNTPNSCYTCRRLLDKLHVQLTARSFQSHSPKILSQSKKLNNPVKWSISLWAQVLPLYSKSR